MGGIASPGAGVSLKRTSVTVTFNGNANTGAVGAVPLFTVTGEVLIAVIVPFCTATLVSAGGGTLSLGVTGSTALFIAATTGTSIAANDFWVDTGPDANGIALPAAMKDVVITDNIVGAVLTAAITGGTIRFDVYWLPLSPDGFVS